MQCDVHSSCLLLLQDNSTNLLHYLVTQYVGKYEKHSGTDHAQLPLPEPSDVSQAAAVDFDDLQRELNRLRTTLEGFFDLTNVKYNIVTCLWSN